MLVCLLTGDSLSYFLFSFPHTLPQNRASTRLFQPFASAAEAVYNATGDQPTRELLQRSASVDCRIARETRLKQIRVVGVIYCRGMSKTVPLQGISQHHPE
jgi:hypothetical protein